MSKVDRVFMFLSKWMICSWYHKKHRCYPEVWDRGLDGPWHCPLCYPCGMELDELIRTTGTEEEFASHCKVNGIRRGWFGRYYATAGSKNDN